MKVATVIVTYNRKEMLRRNLRALYEQTRSPDGLFVVDNASSDGTEHMIRNEFPSVRYVRMQENEGLFGGLHAGMLQAFSGDFDAVWLMDDDAYPRRDALENLLTVIKRNDLSNACVFCANTTADERIFAEPVSVFVDGEIQTYIEFADSIRNKLLKCTWGGNSGMFIPRSVVQSVGLPRADMFFCGEPEYLMRIKRHGLELYYYFGSIVYHEVTNRCKLIWLPAGLVRLRRPFWRRYMIFVYVAVWHDYYGIRNMVYAYWNTYRGVERLRAVVFVLIGNIAKLCYGDMKLERVFFLSKAFRDGVIGKLGKDKKVNRYIQTPQPSQTDMGKPGELSQGFSAVQVESVESCALCGRRGRVLHANVVDRLGATTDAWLYQQCPRDGLVWLNPRPVRHEHTKLYRSYFTHDVRETVTTQLSQIRNKLKKAILRYSYDYDTLDGSTHSIFGRIVSFIPLFKERVGTSVAFLNKQNSCTLLDVGCGSGDYLLLMKNLGWNVTGIEPDEKAARIAETRLNAHIYNCSFEDVRLPAHSYDAITLRHVLEHVRDPLAFLRKCGLLLKKGGMIVVTTPNIESLGCRVFKESWLPLDAPRHLYLYSRSTLEALVRRSGFSVHDIHTMAWGIQTAREVFCQSALLKRGGRMSAHSAPHCTLALSVGGIMFQLVEHFLQLCGQEIGEELLLIGLKA